jgi:hypothetical protein
MNNIPEEVLWVMAITNPYSGTFYCGMEMYNKINAIIDKYPKYFPQEHIYKKIPQSIKDKFESEKHDLYKKYNPFYFDIKEGEGIVGYMNRKYEENKNKPKESLFETLERITKRDFEYNKELKLLHDKFFKSYGYKFTGS